MNSSSTYPQYSNHNNHNNHNNHSGYNNSNRNVGNLSGYSWNNNDNSNGNSNGYNKNKHSLNHSRAMEFDRYGSSYSNEFGPMNPNDTISWKFDYIYDWKNTGSKIHSIKNNGKTLVCNCGDDGCNCFYISYSFGMKPQSGIFKIKIKINNIYNTYANVIGIISQHSKNNEIIKNNQNNQNNDNDKTLYWYNHLYDYIGWSTCGSNNDTHLPNGLLCGWNGSTIQNNVFRRNNFVYQSNNENYKNRLPPINSGDIIELSYDSNNGILLFCKENDNGKLNAQIYNLPTDNTYYWFVGHYLGKLCLSVL